MVLLGTSAFVGRSGPVPEVGVLIAAPGRGGARSSTQGHTPKGRSLPLHQLSQVKPRGRVSAPLPCAHYVGSYLPSPRQTQALSRCSVRTTEQLPSASVPCREPEGSRIGGFRTLFPFRMSLSFLSHGSVCGHSFGAFPGSPNQACAQIKTCQGNKHPRRTKGASLGTVTVMATFFCGDNGH